MLINGLLIMAAETERHVRPEAHFTKVLWAHNLNLVKNTGSIHVKNDEPNMVLYYTCHMPMATFTNMV